jgi:hypothetical protein
MTGRMMRNKHPNYRGAIFVFQAARCSWDDYTIHQRNGAKPCNTGELGTVAHPAMHRVPRARAVSSMLLTFHPPVPNPLRGIFEGVVCSLFCVRYIVIRMSVKKKKLVRLLM